MTIEEHWSVSAIGSVMVTGFCLWLVAGMPGVMW